MRALHLVLLLAAAAAAQPALAQEKSREPLSVSPLAGSRALEAGKDTAWSPIDAVTIAEVQRRLKNEGYYIGEVNGFFDNNTQSALLDFQTDRNLALSGHMDGQTMAALGFPADTQQAQVPLGGDEAATDETGRLQRLRSEQMTSPNVGGQAAPQQRTTGVPATDEPPEPRGQTD